MRKKLRALYRRLTFKRRLRVGGPLFVTVPRDGVYMLSIGDKHETRTLKAGEELRVRIPQGDTAHVSWISETR